MFTYKNAFMNMSEMSQFEFENGLNKYAQADVSNIPVNGPSV